MHRLVISAPFGNYVGPRGATRTLGTFTLARRPGRVWRVVRTVRRYRRLGAWVNRIGLRNPGIEWLASRVERRGVDVSDKIVSVHGFEAREWGALVERVVGLGAMAVELNMSCPNVGEVSWPEGLFERSVEACAGRTRVIVKLPPVRFEAMAVAALDAGVRAFHCCNTLPVPGGGMSGKPLMPMSLRCVGDTIGLAARAGVGRGELLLIGGGGITGVEDIDRYAEAGATHVALGTKVMHPRYLWSEGDVRALVGHADGVLAGRGPVPAGAASRVRGV